MEHTFKNLDEFESVTPDVVHRYNDLIFQLKGIAHNATVEALEEVRTRQQSELLLFVLSDKGEIAGMAQASYHCTPAKYAVYVSTVVIDEKYRGQGVGKLLMNELEDRTRARWPNVERYTLMSNPKRETQGFYLKLGYRMRTEEFDDAVTVYVKDIDTAASI